MSKICYVPKVFNAKHLDLIRKAEAICIEFKKQGYILTLRQLYYQFVSRDFLANTLQNYKMLGNVINDARLAGLIDWAWMEDRTRNMKENGHWTNPAAIVEACASQFQLDKWVDQPFYVEIWVEKEALAGVVERAARNMDVPFFSCRGYVSQSEMHSAAVERFKTKAERGRKGIIVHLGDHDPSGIDMTRDIEDRFDTFQVPVKVNRIALNYDQIQTYNPPPNPAKMTDSRFDGYSIRFGDESWELDALNPKTLVSLMRDAVLSYRDEDKFAVQKAHEDVMRAELQAASDNWSDLVAWLKDNDLL